jgi:hypothetical protein
MTPGSTVDLTGLKRFALQALPSGPLRDDVISQPDRVGAEEFLANARVWLRLARAG